MQPRIQSSHNQLTDAEETHQPRVPCHFLALFCGLVKQAGCRIRGQLLIADALEQRMGIGLQGTLTFKAAPASLSQAPGMPETR